MLPSDEDEPEEENANDTEKKKRGQRVVLSKRKQRQVDDEDGILVEEDTNQGTVSFVCAYGRPKYGRVYPRKSTCLPSSKII